jgi:hypothetical protein
MSKSQRQLLWVLFVACWMNLLAVFVVGHEIGDAYRGKVVDGHFYVSRRGGLVEVSESSYKFARLQFSSIFLTIPLAGLIWRVLKRNPPKTN